MKETAMERAESADELMSTKDKEALKYFLNCTLSSLSLLRTDISDDAWVTDFTFGKWADPNILITLGLVDDNMQMTTNCYHQFYIAKSWLLKEYQKFYRDMEPMYDI
jgi:hypothetical protein